MTYSRAKDQGQRSVGSKDKEYTDGRMDRWIEGLTDGGDCITQLANAVGKNWKWQSHVKS